MLDHEEIEPAVERLALELRRPVDLGNEVDVAVMSAIRAAPLMVTPLRAPARAPRRHSLWRALARPRTVRLHVSPLAGIAAAVLAVAALIGLRREEARQTAEQNFTGEFPGPTGEYRAPTPPKSNGRTVAARDTIYVTRFMLVAPEAREVALVGDFNDWEKSATPLEKKNGVWTVTVPLSPGRYSYAFLVDGQRWTADPAAPRNVGDDFGRPSSVITVRET